MRGKQKLSLYAAPGATSAIVGCGLRGKASPLLSVLGGNALYFLGVAVVD